MSSSLEDRLNSDTVAIPWIPDPEKAAKYDKESCALNPLIGTAVDHFRRTNFRGDGEYDVVVLNVEGVGDVAVHCQATVLSNEMRDARPRPGEKVGVRWLGMVQGTNQEYAAYKVIVERDSAGGFNWGVSSDGGLDDQPEAQREQRAPLADGPPPPTDDDIPF